MSFNLFLYQPRYIFDLLGPKSELLKSSGTSVVNILTFLRLLTNLSAGGLFAVAASQLEFSPI